MKQIRILFLLAACIVSLQAMSQDSFTDGNLRYTITSTYFNTVSVGAANTAISGEVKIPKTVLYNGAIYTVTAIKYNAFWNCRELTSIIIPNSVLAIEYLAFGNCSSLKKIEIPNSVVGIGTGAFAGCSSLTSITIPNGVTEISQDMFDGCSSLTSVTMSNSVTNIGIAAFYNCVNLTSITIPNSVTGINESAFENCTSLTSITIPSSVEYIFYKAFYGCSNLTAVTSLREEPPSYVCFIDSPGEIDRILFSNYNIPLYVPAGCISKYKTADGWKQFTNIQEIGGGGVSNKCATPTISFGGKKLSFDCETEGVEYVTEIKDADVGMFYDDKIALSATYEISVFATKAGYENSDKATATLVWTNATFTDTTPLTAINHVLQSHAMPVLIQSNKGTVTVQGADDGTQIGIYTVAGLQAGSAVSNNGSAIIHTDIQVGSVAIVKIGGKAVKILIK